jgi:hypothetical protein
VVERLLGRGAERVGLCRVGREDERGIERGADRGAETRGAEARGADRALPASDRPRWADNGSERSSPSRTVRMDLCVVILPRVAFALA